MLVDVYGQLSRGKLRLESLPHSRDNAYCKLTLTDENGVSVEISAKASEVFLAAQTLDRARKIK